MKHYYAIPNGKEVDRITSYALFHLYIDCFCEVKINTDRSISLLSKHLKRTVPQGGILISHTKNPFPFSSLFYTTVCMHELGIVNSSLCL